MKLIITEKPDVAKQIVKAIAPNAHFETVSQSKRGRSGFYENGEYVICYSVGHIVEIKEPKEINEENDWNLEHIPYILPDELPTKISKDKKDVFATIQAAFNKYDYDEIIIATDGDREGQNIWRKIALHLKKYNPKKESRVWLNEWTDQGIKDSFKNRFPNSKKENLGLAAQVREEEDYKWGMQGTVVCTKKFNKNGYGSVISVGRVMTPTMKFVNDREKEIQNFKPEPYKVVSIVTSTNTADTLELKHDAGKKRLTKEEGEEIYQKEKNKTKYNLV